MMFDQQRYMGLNVERYFLGHEVLGLAATAAVLQQQHCSCAWHEQNVLKNLSKHRPLFSCCRLSIALTIFS